jgi:hypothetical protein
VNKQAISKRDQWYGSAVQPAISESRAYLLVYADVMAVRERAEQYIQQLTQGLSWVCGRILLLLLLLALLRMLLRPLSLPLLLWKLLMLLLHLCSSA